MEMYKIVQSNSNGNAIVYNKDIMVDCGVAYLKLKYVYKDLKLILLTHIHRRSL